MPEEILNPGDNKSDTNSGTKDGASHQDIPSNFGDNIGPPIPPAPVPVSEIASNNTEKIETVSTDTAAGDIANEEEYEYVEDEYSSRGFISRIDDLMQDLNLSRRHFVIFSGCFTLLLIGIIFSFVLLFHFFGQESKDVVAPQVVEVQTEDKTSFFDGWFSFLSKDEADKTTTDNSQSVEVVDTEESLDNSNEEDTTDEVGFFEKWFTLNGDKASDSTDNNENTSEDVSENSDSDNIEDSTESNLEDKTSITVSSQLGNMTLTEMESVGVKASIAYGLASISEDKLSYYVRTYRKVRNIFNTDLFSYLNALPSREEGFDEFIITFKGAKEQAKLAYEDLLQEIELYDNRYGKLNDRSLEIEQEFFASLDALESEELPELLAAFQDITNQKTVVKSELAARRAVAEKYAVALPFIEKKIEALEVNRDPFVKGVKVVEFNQVDLDLIIEGQ